MISSSDPFAQTFDSIRLDRSVPLPSELEAGPDTLLPAFGAEPTAGPSPLLFDAQEMTAAGFYLLDDAGGRFTIDRETGIVTLAQDQLMALEAGAIHPVHIKVIEHSGAEYELRFRLRMTGRIPQIAGAEENDALANLAAAPLLDLMSADDYGAFTPPDAECPWSTFSLTHWQAGAPQRLGSERAIYGSLLETPPLTGYFASASQLALAETLPSPAPAAADWRI